MTDIFKYFTVISISHNSEAGFFYTYDIIIYSNKLFAEKNHIIGSFLTFPAFLGYFEGVDLIFLIIIRLWLMSVSGIDTFFISEISPPNTFMAFPPRKSPVKHQGPSSK